MSNPSLYKDLAKRISDLLSKDFPLGERKVEWKGETQGVTLESNFSIKGDNIVGTLTPKYKYGKTNFLAESNTRKEFKVEVSREEVAPGLKVTGTATSKGEELYGTLATEYKHQYAAVTAGADIGRANGTTLRSSLVVAPGIKGVSLGASVEYLAGNGENQLKELNTILSYSQKEIEVNLFGRTKTAEGKSEVGSSFLHQVNPATTVVGEIVFDAHRADVKPKLSVLAAHKWSSDTTLKGKLDTTGQLSFSYQQLFANQTKLTLGSAVDINNLSEKTTKFGAVLSLNF